MKRALLAGSVVALLLAAVSASASSSTAPANERKAAQLQGVILLAQADPEAEQLLPRKKKQAQRKGADKQNQAAPARKRQAEAAQPQANRQQKAAAQQERAPKPRIKALKPEPRAVELPRKKQKKAVAQQEPASRPRIKAAQPEPRAAELPRKKQKKAIAQQEVAPKPRIKAPKPEPRAADLPRKKQKKAITQEAPPKPRIAAPEPEPRAAELPRKKQKKAVAQQETAPKPERKLPTATIPEAAPREQQAEEVPGAAPAAPGAKDKRKLRRGIVATEPAEDLVPPDPKAARKRPEKAAPVLDSAKEPPAEPGERTASIKRTQRVRPPDLPPADDRAAQEEAQLAEIQAVTTERGERTADPPPPMVEIRPEGVDVVREIGDRVVIEINNTIIVESSDRSRLTRNAREVYYEDLPRGRIRETVIREDGTQVITIRNRYGDIVRRSRIAPDGREFVLVYVDDRDYERLDDWRDPGLDLPPLQLTVPVSEYVLDAYDVEDPDVYYEFLERPPVEPVERLYSVDEVKRSARIRDKVPRIELDTITFDFGSAAIGEDQVPKLEGVAQAMERLLQKNPGESFLIEGHTDLVGSDVANLALSDRRAESVADALTNVFAIPPENLATQGYGERYPKVSVEEQEPLNRRVVIRRITPLVAPAAPVASAN